MLIYCSKKGGALLHPHRGCSGHWPPSSVQVFPLLLSLPLASWIVYVLLLGVNVLGGVVLGLVWCVLCGFICVTCGFLLVIGLLSQM